MHSSSFASWFAVCSLAAAAHAQGSLTINNVACEALSAVRDIDGDGVRDLVFGIPSTSRVQFHSGRTGALIHTSVGPASSRYGAALANLGDIDGDTFDDIAVGAPLTGQAFVIPSVGGAVTRTWTAFVPGTSCVVSDRYGFSIASAGDLNGDGISEVLIGDPHWRANPANCWADGIAEIVDVAGAPALVTSISGSGLPANLLTQPPCVLTAAGPAMGFSVAGIGDVDLDSVPDIVVGAPGHDVAFAYSGASLAPGLTPVVLAQMPGSGNYVTGVSAVGFGDVDSDGRPEVAIGAMYFTTSGSLGSVFAYRGQKIATAAGGPIRPYGTYSINPPGLGWSVAAVGDYDGDSRADFLAGAGGPCNSSFGSAYVFSGVTVLPLATHGGAGAGSTYGVAVHAVGDISTAGTPRYMIADPGTLTVSVR